MKNLKKKTLVIVNLLFVMIIGSCKKGEIGPQGSQGPQGTSGIDGSSNVKVITFSIVPTSDINTGFVWNNVGSYYEHIKINIPELTQSVIDSGAVIVYISTSHGWQGMPWTEVLSSNTHTRTYNFAYDVNQIWVMIEQTYLNQTQWSMQSAGYTYKIVVVPNSMRLGNPNLNWSDYSEVASVFNLTD